MKKGDKELLLKDLCERLPYNVKIKTSYDRIKEPIRLLSINPNEGTFTVGGKFTTISGLRLDLYDCKPYLFPLSSMTKKQKKEYDDNLTYHDYTRGGWAMVKDDDEYIIPYWFVDFCNKNHLDYRGLIEKGLAIDATGLNIY